jgi:hypothetical protein
VENGDTEFGNVSKARGRQPPPDLSDAARWVWDQMRDGRIQNAVALFDAAKRGLV